jgi:hypothetical protein
VHPKNRDASVFLPVFSPTTRVTTRDFEAADRELSRDVQTRGAMLGLTVRVHELPLTATNGNILHLEPIVTATYCSEIQGMETNLYARSYARIAPRLTTSI